MEQVYSVLVVDDEPTILQGMVATYAWDAAGFSVLDTASSGEEALQKVKAQRLDVIVADIRMKKMDGLELIRQVRELSEQVVFVVMSAYKDFTYAQTACDLGAFSYLLKPFTDEEFLSVMSSLRAYLDKRGAKDRLLDMFARHQDDILVHQLRGYLTGGVAMEALQSNLSHLPLSLGGWFCCVCADIDVTTEIFLGDAPGHRYVQYRLLTEVVGKQYPLVHFDLPDNRLLMVIHLQTAEKGIVQALSTMVDQLEAQGYAYYMACGELLAGLEGLRRSFEQCLAGIELTYERDSDHLILYRSGRQATVSRYLYPKNMELEILGALKTGDYAAMEEKVSRFQDILEDMRAGLPFVHSSYQMLCLNIQFLLFQLYDVDGEDLTVLRSLMSNLNKLDKSKLPSTLRYAVLDTIKNYEKRAAGRLGNAAPYVQRAIQYIEEHLEHGELSVVEVADSLHLNAAYFGRMFKQTTGRSFREFLLSRRMERAKVLLSTSNMTITEIAMAVGMESPPYFSSQFKKYTGALPSVFRGL